MTYFSSRRPGTPENGLSSVEDRIDVEALLAENNLGSGHGIVTHFLDRLIQGDVSNDTRHTLENYMDTGDFGRSVPFDVDDPVHVDKKVRGLINLIEVLPSYQLN
jgi:hypothetical protein